MGNKNLLSFPKHDTLKYRRLKRNVNSQYNMQINQSHYLDHFPICQEANGVSKEIHVQTTSNFRLKKIAQAGYHIRVTEVGKDMCDN